MKKHILFWIFNNRHRLDKKIGQKILIGLAVVVTFGAILIGLVTYAGFKAVQYVAGQLPAAQTVVDLNQQVQQKVMNSAQGFQLQKCTAALQQRLDLNIWLNRPLSENYTELLQACFQQSGHDQPKTTKETRNDQSHI